MHCRQGLAQQGPERGAVYAQPSVKDRVRIERWKLAKIPVREIARMLQRSKATIYREIKRNWFRDECLPGYDGYDGAAAHRKATDRRARQRKLIRHPELRNQVVERVKNGWTPEQIGNRLIHEGAKLRVCHALPNRVSPKAMSREEDDLPLHLLDGRHGAGALVVPARTPQGPSAASRPQAPSAKIRP